MKSKAALRVFTFSWSVFTDPGKLGPLMPSLGSATEKGYWRCVGLSRHTHISGILITFASWNIGLLLPLCGGSYWAFFHFPCEHFHDLDKKERLSVCLNASGNAFFGDGASCEIYFQRYLSLTSIHMFMNCVSVSVFYDKLLIDLFDLFQKNPWSHFRCCFEHLKRKRCFLEQ